MNQEQKSHEKLKAIIEYLQYNGPVFLRSSYKIKTARSLDTLSPIKTSVIS
ncbi:MAG: hypothetical protein ACFFAU_00425 [Candidatus Hodarchaeota archaeon]